MRRHSRRAAAALVTALAIGATTWGGAGRAATTVPPGSDALATSTESADAFADVNRDGEFHFGIQYGWASFGDPQKAVSEGDQIWFRPVYERLLSFGQTADGGIELVPQLATDWEASDDGLSLTYQLRDGVVFHDGNPFDADAVKANIERAMTLPDSTVKAAYANVESVEVVDPLTVVLHLTQPDPALPWAMASAMNGMMISPAAFDTDLAANPVGTGPYTLVSIEKDADAVYERFDGHWDPDAALAQRLVISTVFDANARYNGLRNDEFDAVYLTSPLDAESRSLEDEGYHWVQSLPPINFGIAMNSDLEPFTDVRVRQAVNLAINRTEISESLQAGLMPPISQIFGPGYLGHDPDLPADVFDPDEARRLISEAGAEGASFDMLVATSEPGNSMSVVVQQQLADVGLNVNLVPLSPSEQAPAWRRGDTAPAALIHLTGQPEPSMTLTMSYLPGGINPASSIDPVISDMAAEGLLLPVGSDEREAHYRELNDYIFENPVHAPLVQFSSVTVCRPEVAGCENLFEIGKYEWRHIGVTD